MFIQLHKPKSTGEIISLERRLYEVVQKEWDSQEPTGHSFAQQTQKDVSTVCYDLLNSRATINKINALRADFACAFTRLGYEDCNL